MRVTCLDSDIARVNALLVESPRGVRFAKKRASRRVDAAVELAMAVQAF